MKTSKKIISMALVSVTTLIAGYSYLNKDITLIIRGVEKQVSTFEQDVESLLESEEITYDSNDILSVDIKSKLIDDMKIELIDVTEETIVTPKELDYEIKTVNDDTLLKGDTKIVTEGKVGEKEIVHKITYHNGVEVEKELVEEIVSANPIDKVVSVGTKVEVKKEVKTEVKKTSSNTAQQVSTNSTSKGEHMSVEATAYTGGGITATGTNARWGVIAVDPNVIPYGTKVYIPQFNQTFIAEDCGGAIKGNKIDIYMNDTDTVYDWGRRNIDIYIMD